MIDKAWKNVTTLYNCLKKKRIYQGNRKPHSVIGVTIFHRIHPPRHRVVTSTKLWWFYLREFGSHERWHCCSWCLTNLKVLTFQDEEEDKKQSSLSPILLTRQKFCPRNNNNKNIYTLLSILLLMSRQLLLLHKLRVLKWSSQWMSRWKTICEKKNLKTRLPKKF